MVYKKKPDYVLSQKLKLEVLRFNIQGKLFKAISKKGIYVTIKIKELRNIPKNIPIKKVFKLEENYIYLI